MPSIRVIAVGVLIHRNHLLCMHGFDSVKSETYYRPLGGGIEFGERVADAVVREIREEIGREVEVIEHLATTESIFTYEGRPYHEFAVELVVRFRRDAYPPGQIPICHRGSAMNLP